jgi:hypothetical protein
MKCLLDILKRHWNKKYKKHKSFIARQAVQLIGNLISCLKGCHWLKLLTFELTRLLRTSLSQNSHQLIHTKHFDGLLQEKSTSCWLVPTAGQRDTKILGLKSEAREHSGTASKPPAGSKSSTRHRRLHRWCKPRISHIVRRKEDQLQYQEVSTTTWATAGSHIASYWQLAWTDFGPEVANWVKTTQNKKAVTTTPTSTGSSALLTFGLALSAILEK